MYIVDDVVNVCFPRCSLLTPLLSNLSVAVAQAHALEKERLPGTYVHHHD